MAQLIRHDAILLFGRQVDPKIFFRNSQASQEIFDQLGRFIGQGLTLKGALAVINNEIKQERIFRMDGHAFKYNGRKHFGKAYHGTRLRQIENRLRIGRRNNAGGKKCRANKG